MHHFELLDGVGLVLELRSKDFFFFKERKKNNSGSAHSLKNKMNILNILKQAEKGMLKVFAQSGSLNFTTMASNCLNQGADNKLITPFKSKEQTISKYHLIK